VVWVFRRVPSGFVFFFFFFEVLKNAFYWLVNVD